MAVNIVSTIKTYISHILNINSTKANKSGIANYFGNQYTLNISSVTKGSNYSSVTDTQAVLCGNMLRIYFVANRSSNSGAGNITNEDIVTLKIDNPNGLIASYINVGGNTGKTGGLATFYSYVDSINSSSITLRLVLVGTHAAVKQFNGYILIPVKLNISY